MRISLSLMTFDGKLNEKLLEASKFNTSSLHIDYLDDFDLEEVIIKTKKSFTNFDLHIISQNPFKVLKDLKLKNLLPPNTFVQVESLEEFNFENFQELNVSMGIQVNTDIKIFESHIKKSESILLMTTTPGKSFGKFNDKVFDLILEVKSLNPRIKIYVDGGVSDKQFEKLKTMGVQTVVIGSYLAKALNFKESLSKLTCKVEDNNLLVSISETVEELPSTESLNIVDILNTMAQYRENFVLITENGNIKGILTDGDIKREILLNQEIKMSDIIVKPNEEFIFEKEDSRVYDLLKKINLEVRLGAIPLIDNNNMITKAVRLRNLL